MGESAVRLKPGTFCWSLILRVRCRGGCTMLYSFVYWVLVWLHFGWLDSLVGSSRWFCVRLSVLIYVSVHVQHTLLYTNIIMYFFLLQPPAPPPIGNNGTL